MPRAAFNGRRALRLPFFYGWVIVAAVFVTMGIGVNARTASSLLFPPILEELGWAGPSRPVHSRSVFRSLRS